MAGVGAMTMLNTAQHAIAVTGHEAGESRAQRLQALRAMLMFAAHEADALGESSLTDAIGEALETAEAAVSLSLARPFSHDA